MFIYPIQNERWSWKQLKGTFFKTCEHQKLVYSTNPRCRKQPDFMLLFIQFTYHYTFKTTTASWGFTLTSDKSLNAVEVEEETVQGLNNWAWFSKQIVLGNKLKKKKKKRPVIIWCGAHIIDFEAIIKENSDGQSSFPVQSSPSSEIVGNWAM